MRERYAGVRAALTADPIGSVRFFKMEKAPVRGSSASKIDDSEREFGRRV